MDYQKCKKCGNEYPATIEYFHKRSRNKNGLDYSCKKCACAYVRTKSIELQHGKYKACAKCGKELPATINFFHKKKTGKYGLKSECKDCFEIYRKQYAAINKDSIKEYHKKYNIENKEEKSLKSRVFYEKNKTKIRARQNEYYFNNREKIREKDRLWTKNNPERKSASLHKRKARMKNLKTTLTSEQWEDIMKTFDNSCAYCGSKKKLTKDHFIPLSNGGDYTIQNIIPACRSCNSSKRDTDFYEWYPQKEIYSQDKMSKIETHLTKMKAM